MMLDCKTDDFIRKLCRFAIYYSMTEDLKKLAASHYENFPVGSRFIPARYREAVHLIYAYARTADDIADEGNSAPADRIAKLDEWQRLLHAALNGSSGDSFFSKLAETINRHKLSPDLLNDLLVAFRRDASSPIYSTFEDLLEYCRYSANPIGRLMLQIFQCANKENERLSDLICSALQLSNFWQDISVDTGRNRFYISRTDLERFGLTLDDLRTAEKKSEFRTMMAALVRRTKTMFEEGKPLIGRVSKDLRFELSLIWHGGMRILEKIEQQGFDTRHRRPALTVIDKLIIFIRAIRFGE